MKAQIVNCNRYRTNTDNLYKSKQQPSSINFEGGLPASKTPVIDWILTNKTAQKLFNLASMNPHTFNLTVMALMGIAIRPATILVFPGAKKEDKQYAAGKSVISSIITTISQAALCIPLAKTIEKFAKEAEKSPKIVHIPKISSKEFAPFNYLINNGFAVILTVVSSMIMAEAVTKIMNKILPNKKNSPTKFDFSLAKINDSTPKAFKDFMQKSGVQ